LRGGELDVVVVVLARPRLSREDRPAVNLLEVAVRELVARLRLLVGVVVDAEVPATVLGSAVLLDELVLLRRRRLMLAPIVAVVAHGLAVIDELLRVLEPGAR